MVSPHPFTVPHFTMTEAADIGRVEYTVLNAWLARGLIQIGQKPSGARRTLYSITDIVIIAVVADLNRIISMRPGFSSAAFIDKTLQRMEAIARDGFGKKGGCFLVGWQSGPDTFSVKPSFKMRGVDWEEFNHPVVVVPLDAIINRILDEALRRAEEGAYKVAMAEVAQ